MRHIGSTLKVKLCVCAKDSKEIKFHSDFGKIKKNLFDSFRSIRMEEQNAHFQFK